ncbi:hypothetical protein Tco_0431485 [Tanacetum coccineum]
MPIPSFQEIKKDISSRVNLSFAKAQGRIFTFPLLVSTLYTKLETEVGFPVLVTKPSTKVWKNGNVTAKGIHDERRREDSLINIKKLEAREESDGFADNDDGIVQLGITN